MASISKLKDGRRLIQFYDRAGKRQTIRLGKVARRAAESVKLRVEDLISASITGHAVPDETARWIAQLDAPMTNKLAAVDLIPKAIIATLGEFLDAYFAERSDVKDSTRTIWGHTRRNLIDYFGKDKPLRTITEADADAWRANLKSTEELSDNTCRRRCGIAKQFFRAAVRRKLIRENPFGHLVGAIRANKTREYFVSRADAERIIDKCPDAEWRLLFGLSRYGGVRCPSETLAIRWDHIDWDRSRITVPSPKTEHHVGGESREIPIFPELRPLLEDAFELAEPGAEFLISRYRDTSVNLRTQLKRIIARAKLQPWPKLFHNLRSTRETELAETYPAHVVCAWIGNSQTVAQKHYLQITDEHFDRAARCEALQNALQSVQESPCTDENAIDDERAETPANTGVFVTIQSDSYLDKMAGLGAEGLEPPTLSV